MRSLRFRVRRRQRLEYRPWAIYVQYKAALESRNVREIVVAPPTMLGNSAAENPRKDENTSYASQHPSAMGVLVLSTNVYC